MNKCLKCNVNLHVNDNICPLCHNKVENVQNDSIFPEIKSKYKFHNLLVKISLLLSLCGVIFSSFINYIISKEISWALFVNLGILSFWITFIIGIKRRKNFMKLLFTEIVVIIGLAIIWDKYTGFYKWSLIYVLPLLCISYMITFLILRIFTNKINKDHIIHTYLNSLIGLIPLYFIFKKNINPLWPSYISVFTSIFTLIFIFIFNHKTLEHEMKRRLHI